LQGASDPGEHCIPSYTSGLPFTLMIYVGRVEDEVGLLEEEAEDEDAAFEKDSNDKHKRSVTVKV